MMMTSEVHDEMEILLFELFHRLFTDTCMFLVVIMKNEIIVEIHVRVFYRPVNRSIVDRLWKLKILKSTGDFEKNFEITSYLKIYKRR